jgi:hypothetical protein
LLRLPLFYALRRFIKYDLRFLGGLLRRPLKRLSSPMKKPATGVELNAHEWRVCSQNGEDGIIAEIFSRIGTTDRLFVEFGVDDGLECNGAYLARFCGWSGIMLEGGAATNRRLVRNYEDLPRIRTGQYFITRENIAEVFRELAVPAEFDLLSIDIDGNDYWVWQALSQYRPRVVIIEYNAAYPPPMCWIMAYNAEHLWDGTSSYQGASLSALTELALRLGYALVCTDSNGVNAFFIRQDLLESSTLIARTPEEAYHLPNFKWFQQRHQYGSGPWVASGENGDESAAPKVLEEH